MLQVHKNMKMKLKEGQKESILKEVKDIRKESENRCHVWMVIDAYYELENEGLLDDDDYRIKEILVSNMAEKENNPKFKSKLKSTHKFCCLLCGATKLNRH